MDKNIKYIQNSGSNSIMEKTTWKNLDRPTHICFKTVGKACSCDQPNTNVITGTEDLVKRYKKQRRCEDVDFVPSAQKRYTELRFYLLFYGCETWSLT